MDTVTSTANTVVQQSADALSLAANELAKQANSVAMLASTKDPIAWLAGDDGDEDDLAADERPSSLVPVPLAALQPWAARWASDAPAEVRAPATRSPPFAPDRGINLKVILWQGEILSLEAEALLTPAAAGYAPGASTVLPRVLQRGGTDLRTEIGHLDACRSGEARIAKSYGLPCHRLLLTVGPKYKDKYHIAAQNTLNACYRECFQLLVEAELRTVAIPCTWYHKGYPPEEQAHVALRTVRRCLEKLPAVDAVVFVAESAAEAELYEGLLPWYFPRTQHEAEAAAELLPDSCWTPWGEVAVEERRIRVSSHLISSCEDEDDNDRGAPLFSPANDADRAFLDAREDADEVARRRLEGTMIDAESVDVARHVCLRYLRRAQEMRAEPEATRFVHRAGQDRFGRGVVVLLGARLPSLGIRDERTLPLFVKELELLKCERFVLLYVNSDVSALDASKFEVLQEMLAVVSAKYRSSLDQLLVLHPGLGFRAAFALGRAVSDLAASVWHDTVYLEGLADLSCYLAGDLGLPEYVRACDFAG